MKKRFALIAFLLIGMIALAPLGAQEAAKAAAPKELHSSGDFIWIMIAAFLVFFMQAGFAMVETGFTRAKNAGNIMMKNLFDFSMGSIAFFVVGYGLMFGATKLGLIGSSGFFLADASPKPDADGGNAGLWQYAYFLFQLVFAATAATIVSGAMAERTKFVSYLAYSLVISALIYPVSGHWIWNANGWLAKLGFQDFAGSTVVHMVGGVAAMMGALVLGPRYGKYGPDGKPRAIPGHNIPLAALGVFILWFGWFGFNPGSTTAATPSIAFIAINTNLAAAAGALASMAAIWIQTGKPDVSMSLNGALAGLVAITAGCNFVSPASSIVIGLIAGVVVVLAVQLFDFVFKIDDPVGAISVHGVCGALGTILVGVFGDATYGGMNGLINGGGFKLLGIQALGALVVFGWVAVTAGILFLVIKKTIGLRVSREEELKGLDIEEHGMESYSGFQIFRNQ
ncbi:MAG TPA: ammonium transporter [Spirochaetota bacterium]|nr:ammonium transporter [Spirochaetota bacterium]HPI22801.1 ammonium transporter [Spirochaetota bacterium]HPU87928.1 ammonium transporter [Spirochaetota bacterium]